MGASFSNSARAALWAVPFTVLAGIGFFWLAAPTGPDVVSPAPTVATPAPDAAADAAPMSRGASAPVLPDRRAVVVESAAAAEPSPPGRATAPAAPGAAQKPGLAWRPARADVERWRFEDAAELDLRGRNFRDAELARVDMAGADLRGADLSTANFRLADLRGANLEGAVLNDTRLSVADLRGARLRGAEVSANFMLADLRGVDLRDARGSPWLLSANLTDADLRGAELKRTWLDEVIFDGADLRGADLADVSGQPRSMRGARYNDRTRFPERWFEQTRSPGARSREQWGLVFVPDPEDSP